MLRITEYFIKNQRIANMVVLILFMAGIFGA